MTSMENRWIPELIGVSTGFVYWLGYAPFNFLTLPMLRAGIMDKIGGEIAEKQKKLTDYTHSLMETRVQNDSLADFANRRDFVHYLLRGRDPETGDTGITLSELKGEANLLVIAGSDTSKSTLTGFFFYLVRNPVVYKRLTDEIRSTFTNMDEIRSGPKLNSLSYLRACIDEALRKNPPVGSLLVRKVLPGGLDIEGVGHIPAGTEVGTPSYAIHHSEEYYSDPFTFRPERWIVDEKAGVTAESVALAQSAFCPFSLGSRGCIGKGLAYLELTIAIATVLFFYDVRLAQGDRTGEGRSELEWGRRRKGEYQMKDVFVSSTEGPVVEFKARMPTATVAA